MQFKALILPFALVAAVSACKKGGPSGGGQSDSPTACADLGTALCSELGEQSSACSSAKSTVEILAPAACQAALGNIAYSKEAISKLRAKCDELMKKLCTDLGETTDSCAMVKRETPKFPPDRCASMLASYDEVLADLKKREAANKPLTPAQQKEFTAGKLGTFGPPNAKVTIIEFSDFECPYCSKAAETVRQVKEKYGNKVRFAFKHFPLSFHKNARTASEACLAAGEQGKFWEYHDLLFANQQSLDRASLEKYAKDLKLNVAKFKKALDDKKYSEQVDKDMKAGEQLGVNGTPTLYVAGKKVSNPTDFTAVSAAIDAALGAGG